MSTDAATREKTNSDSTAAVVNREVASRDKDASPSVQLFQRAHQKMVLMQRVDEQIQQLVNQRRSIQDELRGIQAQINDEFDKILQSQARQSGKLLADFAEDIKRSGVNGVNGNGKKRGAISSDAGADEVSINDE